MSFLLQKLAKKTPTLHKFFVKNPAALQTFETMISVNASGVEKEARKKLFPNLAQNLRHSENWLLETYEKLATDDELTLKFILVINNLLFEIADTHPIVKGWIWNAESSDCNAEATYDAINLRAADPLTLETAKTQAFKTSDQKLSLKFLNRVVDYFCKVFSLKSNPNTDSESYYFKTTDLKSENIQIIALLDTFLQDGKAKCNILSFGDYSVAQAGIQAEKTPRLFAFLAKRPVALQTFETMLSAILWESQQLARNSELLAQENWRKASPSMPMPNLMRYFGWSSQQEEEIKNKYMMTYETLAADDEITLKFVLTLNSLLLEITAVYYRKFLYLGLWQPSFSDKHSPSIILKYFSDSEIPPEEKASLISHFSNIFNLKSDGNNFESANFFEIADIRTTSFQQHYQLSIDTFLRYGSTECSAFFCGNFTRQITTKEQAKHELLSSWKSFILWKDAESRQIMSTVDYAKKPADITHFCYTTFKEAHRFFTENLGGTWKKSEEQMLITLTYLLEENKFPQAKELVINLQKQGSYLEIRHLCEIVEKDFTSKVLPADLYHLYCRVTEDNPYYKDAQQKAEQLSKKAAIDDHAVSPQNMQFWAPVPITSTTVSNNNNAANSNVPLSKINLKL